MELYYLFIEPFQYEFMRNALASSLIAGVIAPITGFWALNRRMVYLMDAMAHSVLPGVILAAIFGFSLLFGGLMAAIVLAAIVFLLSRRGRAPEDGAIGVGSQSLFALGVIIASQTSDSRSFSHILFGNPFSNMTFDLVLLLIAGIIVIGLMATMKQQLIATTFDHEHAEAIGIKVMRVDAVLIVSLASTTVIGLNSVGVLMTISLGVTPAVTTRILRIPFLSGRYWAVAIGIFSASTGLLVSYHVGVPAGPAVALTCTIVLMGAYFYALLFIDRIKSLSTEESR
jgi:ABC-type Mn2+/Zn2+ transport system permease subunit